MRKFLNSDTVVECKICGLQFKQIHWSHLRHHDITTAQYLRKYRLVRGMLMCRDTRLDRQATMAKRQREGSIPKISKIRFENLRAKHGNRKALRILSRTNVNSLIGKKIWQNKSTEERSVELRKRSLKRWSATTRAYRVAHMQPAFANRKCWNKGKTLPPLKREQKVKIRQSLCRYLKEHPFTQDHKDKIRAGLKAYFERRRDAKANIQQSREQARQN